MPKCPSCNVEMIWQSDFMCDEVYGCECADGLVRVLCCSECDKMYNEIEGCENIPNTLVNASDEDDLDT